MMGPTHALSGAVTFLAAAPFLAQQSPAQLAVGAACAAGAALLPDLDHPSASPARAFGPISWLVAKPVAVISGGHRHATHSIIGAGVFTAAAHWASSAGGWPLIVALTLLFGLAIRGLGPQNLKDRRWRLDYADIAGLAHAAAATWAAYMLVTSGMDLGILPWAVAIGVCAHIAGDLLTEQGCPLLWPSLRYYRIASINTDSKVERWVVVPTLYMTLGAVVVYRTYCHLNM